MELLLSDKTMMVRLWQSDAASAPAPSTPIWLFRRFRVVSAVFAARADARAAAPCTKGERGDTIISQSTASMKEYIVCI